MKTDAFSDPTSGASLLRLPQAPARRHRLSVEFGALQDGVVFPADWGVHGEEPRVSREMVWD